MNKLSLTLTAAALLLCGCSAKANAEKSTNIGVVVYDSNDTYINSLMTEFEEYSDQDEDLRITTLDAAKSQITENELVQDLITDGMDVICVNLVDRSAPSSIIDAARQNNVPIIFFNREPLASDLNRWNNLYYVGADSEDSGRLQGQIAASYIASHPDTDRNSDGLIQFYVLEGEPNHQDTIIRSETSVKTLTEAGIKVDKKGYSICNWNRDEAKQRVAKLISEGREIELLLCNNDDMAAGAVDAYRSAGIPVEERPLIVGIDGTRAGLELVESGELIGTVHNDYKGQAKAMYDLSLALARHESKENLNLRDEKYIMLPYTKITADNIREYRD